MDWKVTTGTFNCRAVADEVTIIVKNDWSARCTGAVKYGEGEPKSAAVCQAATCSEVKAYIDFLKNEEVLKANSAGVKN